MNSPIHCCVVTSIAVMTEAATQWHCMHISYSPCDLNCRIYPVLGVCHSVPNHIYNKTFLCTHIGLATSIELELRIRILILISIVSSIHLM